ncbi:cell division protein FtsA, partial [bacterium]|nr:cell division protein FtsA [bacterium]
MYSTVVGLDIGTTKVTAVVGEMIDETHTKVIGMGITPSRGMEKGIVKNVEETSACIQEAIDKAQRMADMAIDYVYIGIAGGHIESVNRTVEIDLREPNTCVTQEDVDLILSMAKDIQVPEDKEIIHTIIREYSLDENRGLKDPVGMTGSKLKVTVHIVLGAISAIRDLVRCAHNVNLDVAEVILQPLASAEAILTEDEKKMGVVLVDIGGGTTDIAVFQKGQLTHTRVIPLGGGHFTNDLSVYLRSPYSEAEKLKIRYGSVDLHQSDLGQSLEVPAVGGEERRKVTVGAVAEVLRARGEELAELVLEDIFESVGELQQLGAGI